MSDFWTEECGTEVTVSFDDRTMAKTFFTATGQRMFTFMIVGSTTLSSADGSVTFTYAQPFRDTLDGTVSILGMPQKTWVNGHELVILDAGRLVLDEDGIAFVAGPHEQFENGVDVCALLGA